MNDSLGVWPHHEVMLNDFYSHCGEHTLKDVHYTIAVL